MRVLGPERVMFGGDNVLNVLPEPANDDSIGLSDEDKKLVLGGSARVTFRLGPA